ncbi:carbohydrate sulfotransferase 11-like [Saccoglossus kowalevskii]|uniref:Carbohydrate sulfotransferase n=1 Tax=Saccoglossus kowalevskii TaxID=10224 RepID=A0ABM0M838_SACKO|nr:PREDICTED: carbohydrate sulfotransferase 11-like [Saccoglossus kowalevskii]
MAISACLVRRRGKFLSWCSIGLLISILGITYWMHFRSGNPPVYRPFSEMETHDTSMLSGDESVTTQLARHTSTTASPADAIKEYGYRHVTLWTYNERLALLKAQCSVSSSTRLPSDVLQRLIVDDVYEFIYCVVQKVASGNWKTALSELKMHYTDEKWKPNLRDFNMGLPTLKEYSPQQIQYRLENYFKFIFVRHPLERMLSAYRDRFERNDKGRLIPQWENIHSLKSFVHYLKETVAKEREDLNIHWRPIANLCQPCEVTYDFIGHYETLDDDVNYIFSAYELSSVINFGSHPSYATGSSNRTILRKYYANLSSGDMLFLHKLYSSDFELFGYSKDSFS